MTLYEGVKPPKPGKSFIDEAFITPLKEIFEPNEPVKLKVSFKVLGHLRESLTERTISDAYSHNDKISRIRFNVDISKTSVLTVRPLLKGRYLRRLRFHWSRNPDFAGGLIGYSTRIWVMVVDEEGNPTVPKDIEHARSLALDFEKMIELPANLLGTGRHKVHGKIHVQWARHTYVEKGSSNAATKPCTVICE